MCLSFTAGTHNHKRSFNLKQYRGRKIRKPYQDRVKALQAQYKDGTPAGFNFAVINCIWRNGLSLDDTAKVLNATRDEINFACDMILQDAQ